MLDRLSIVLAWLLALTLPAWGTVERQWTKTGTVLFSTFGTDRTYLSASVSPGPERWVQVTLVADNVKLERVTTSVPAEDWQRLVDGYHDAKRVRAAIHQQPADKHGVRRVPSAQVRTEDCTVALESVSYHEVDVVILRTRPLSSIGTDPV